MTPLGRLLRDLISDGGPITVERYMALALGHPGHGYYATRDPLGSAGDFTTAPEISQMFGELLGAWAATVWDGLGRPDPFGLVELGPGRGTLMADALRAGRAMPGFASAVRIHLVETSPVLRDAQRRTLAGCGALPAWHDRVSAVPDGPAIVLANEFLDALPIRQFEHRGGGWHERLVGVDGGGLGWGLAPEPTPDLSAAAGRPGDILEVGAAAAGCVRDVAERIGRRGGAALFVDYGHAEPDGRGDTLQAVRRHGFADPLAEPGEADLTTHVNFAVAGSVARAAGARVDGPAGQGDFLRALGLETRATRLRRDAAPEAAAAVDAAVRRLAGPGPDGMGDLFKVLALSRPGSAPLPGFPFHEASIPC